jgi:ribonuclease BN (tRNA processing enzyme)
LQLTIIGSGTAVPQKTRAAPCYLIRHENENIVVDLGPGSARGILVRGGVTVREVGLILLTHLHPDHCSDLVSFLFALRSLELERFQALEIIGPKGLMSHFDGLRAVWGHRVDPLNYKLALREWSGEELTWGSYRISAAPTNHSVPNLAWLVNASNSDGLIVTGDGEPTEELVRMGRSSRHVLIAECSLAAGETGTGHMNPGQAGDLACKCGSQKLVLTHLNPGILPVPAEMEARNQYGGEVIVAEDGMVIEM